MATAVPINLTVEKGADFLVDFNLREENGDFQDLSGFSLTGYFARSYSSSVRYSFAATIPDAATGLIRLELDKSTTVIGTNQPSTASLKAGRYVYNVFITSAGGDRDKVIEGVLTVNPGVL
jgi:hypothetical protein